MLTEIMHVMNFLIAIAILIVAVLFCDRYEDRLPPPLKAGYNVWKAFAHVLGIIMSFLILTLLWIFGFGIYAIIIQLITLPKRFRKEPDSYWIDVEPTTVESMKHQF